MKSISIIITAYNEKKNLQRGVLQEIKDYLNKQSYDWEVIINDDGSTDGTFELLKKFEQKHSRFKIIKGEHGGKAIGLANGIKQAKNEIILTTDIDQSTPLNEIEKLLPYFNDGNDIVIGSRGTERAKFSWFRKLASFLFRIFRQALVLHTITDTQCGFKAYKAKVAKTLFPKLELVENKYKVSGWTVSAFDVELLFMAKKKGYKIAEVPVKWQDEDISDTKDRGGKFIKESFDMLKQILKVRWNWLKGKYN